MTAHTTASALRYAFAAPITLGDQPSQWQQVLSTGTWKHPTYGDMSITPADLRELKQNFDAGARQFVYADYDHGIARADGSGNAIAAGEVKQLELRNNDSELWALYEPTPKAREKIAGKEYRYTSADFDTRYRDKASGKLVGKVFKGFALTNTPYIEGMHPLTLGDASGGRQLFAEFENASDRSNASLTTLTESTMKKIAEKLGLKADASEPEIETKLDALLAEAISGRTLTEQHTAATTAIAGIRTALKLADTATADAVVASARSLAEKNATLEQTGREREADALLDSKLRTGHLTPAQRPDFRKKLLSEIPDVVTATKEILESMPKVVPIKDGRATEGSEEKDYETQLDERTKQIRKDNTKMKYGEALVLAEQQLADAGITPTSTGSK